MKAILMCMMVCLVGCAAVQEADSAQEATAADGIERCPVPISTEEAAEIEKSIVANAALFAAEHEYEAMDDVALTREIALREIPAHLPDGACAAAAGLTIQVSCSTYSVWRGGAGGEFVPVVACTITVGYRDEWVAWTVSTSRSKATGRARWAVSRCPRGQECDLISGGE